MSWADLAEANARGLSVLRLVTSGSARAASEVSLADVHGDEAGGGPRETEAGGGGHEGEGAHSED